MPRPKVKPDDFAFDDDTSGSEADEDLVAFQSKVGDLKKAAPVEEKEELEDDEEESGDNDSDEEESSDEEEAISHPVMSEEKRSKLSKLKQHLAAIESGGESSEEDESDEEEENNAEDDEGGDNDEEGQDDEGEDGDAHSKDVAEPPSTKKRKLEETAAKESSEERAKKKYRDQLSKMTIEDIQKLKERLGVKLFNQKMSGTAPEKGAKVEFKRDNKNRPREMSSKKTVGRFREVVQVAKVERRDPRFDPLCGEFDSKLFKESYQFVNEIKAKELGKLKKQMKEEEDPEQRTKIKYLIQRTENQLRAEAQNKVKEAKEAAEKTDRKEQLKAGEKPFYVSKAKQKESELVEQYEQLKEKGGLDTFIRKKTKKTESKERKKGLGVTKQAL